MNILLLLQNLYQIGYQNTLPRYFLGVEMGQQMPTANSQEPPPVCLSISGFRVLESLDTRSAIPEAAFGRHFLLVSHRCLRSRSYSLLNNALRCC